MKIGEKYAPTTPMALSSPQIAPTCSPLISATTFQPDGSDRWIARHAQAAHRAAGHGSSSWMLSTMPPAALASAGAASMRRLHLRSPVSRTSQSFR